jgi:catechol 2,3-dioxygenase-like lactoylglutathione lyase family enzyme
MVHIPDVWQIQHVGFSVSSIDKSLSIYRDILGMEVALDTEITGDHLKEHFHQPLGLNHKKLRVAVVKSATGVWLELFQFSDPAPRTISGEPMA